MGSVIDLESRRRPREKGHGVGARFVTCKHCDEKHPMIRMANGNEQCFTAFTDGHFWFCQHRGCRAAWLADQD